MLNSVRTETTVRLESPTPGFHIALDPRIPNELEKFAFRLHAGVEARRVEWILDERVIAATDIVEPSSSIYLWHPERGTHTARARVWTEGLEEPRETEAVSFIVK